MALALVATVYVGLFAYYLHATVIRQPYWDMYSYVMRYLQYREDGGWWAYLWEPHVQHRHVWMRLLTAFDAEVFAGVAYPFIVFAAFCQVATAWVLWREVRKAGEPGGAAAGAPEGPPLRPALASATVMLVLTSVSAVTCAIPMNGIYPQTLFFTTLAFVLFDSRGPVQRMARWRRPVALGAAVAAAFANAAALTIWPILLWMAWRTRAGRLWMAVVGVAGSVFIAVYVWGLPLEALGAGGPALESESAGVGALRRSADYLLTYLGLPWTRAAALAVPGRVLGAALLLAGLAAVVRRGLSGPPGTRLERLAVALVLFSLACALLASLGRTAIDSEVLVPVRYSVLVTPLHVGLLILAWPFVARAGARWSRPRLVEGIAVLMGLALLAQQIVAGEAAAATTRAMRVTLERFAAGEESPEMADVVFVNLEQARRQVDAIRRAGLYLDVR